MIKIFFIIVFISELIISLSITIKLLQWDKKVNKLNKMVLNNQNLIQNLFIDFRGILGGFTCEFTNLKQILAQKKQEYLFNFIKTSFVYSFILFSKGKVKHMILAYQLGKEIYEGLLETEM